MSAVVTRAIETSAGKRPCIHTFRFLRVEGYATWRSRCQSFRATIFPTAAAIVSNQQAAIIGGEEHVIGGCPDQFRARVRSGSGSLPFVCQATLRQFEARRSSSSESFVAVRSNTPSKLVPA